MPHSRDVAFDELVARQQPGMSLERPFYTDPAIFEREMATLLPGQWLFVEHETSLPNKGDYALYDIAGESIIVVRGHDHEIRAFFNVCRHRGSRICLAPKGNVRTLTCPYHAWVYDLEGALMHAARMADDFDPGDWPLHARRVRTWEGMIFINLADEDAEVAGFDVIEKVFQRYIKPYRLADTKIIHQATYPTDANWKLAVENFRECYHCSPAHPEYTMVNAYVSDGDRDPEGRSKLVRDWVEEWEGKGVAACDLRNWGDLRDAIQPYGAFRQPIREGSWTLSQDGQPVAPLMGDLKEWDGGETLLIVGPLFYIYLANDHATLFRFTPASESHCEVVVTWLVRADAQEGMDYDVSKVVWMWDVTTIEDTKIINDNQLGVNSRRYVPGRYSEREYGTRNFVAWYLNRMGGKNVAPVAVRQP